MTVFSYGFRPFFLAVGASALLLVPLWAASFASGFALGTDWPPMLWHAHEMLYGFACAAVAGFLLTAVPSWTGQKGFGGWPLVVLSGVWLLARLAIGTSASWPFALVALLDLAFLPLLAALLAVPLVRERNRNTPLLLVLLVLWLGDACFYVGLYREDFALARQALLAAVNLVLILITVIGGRITPSFTANALRQRGIEAAVRSDARVTTVTVVLMIAVAAVDLVRPDSALAGWIAFAAAIAQGVRLAQWQGWRTLGQPILWVLHLAYAWLPVGLLMKALALVGGVPVAAFWLHALTVGVIATMILGVMTRVALGHTGRPLRVRPVTVVAYLLLSAAALVRVFGPVQAGARYGAVVGASATLWAVAFALFLWVYAPILVAPRADGKRG
jgi:uncharacterized protein involved in response to NO